MQAPSDDASDASVPPSGDAEHVIPSSERVESADALTSAPDLVTSVDTSTEMPALAVPAAESRASLAAVGDHAEALNLAERLVAELGAWASTLAERWTPSLGPFFASDGRTAVDSCEILSTLDSGLSTTVS